MFELEQICKNNLSYYSQYENAFENDLKQYQSRIYPDENAEKLRWYHIKSDNKYVGAIWLEKNFQDPFAVLGIFITNTDCRSKGIGTSAIQQIIRNDLKLMGTNQVLLRVREENPRAIACYKKVGFEEKHRYCKNNLNVIEMIYNAD